MLAGLRGTIVYSLTQCCIAIGQEFLGGICQSVSATFASFIPGIPAGAGAGVWKHIFQVLAQDADNEYAMIDSTIVRAHQHSAGAKKGGLQLMQSVAAGVD